MKEKLQPFLVPLAILAAGLLVAGSIVLIGQKNNNPQPTPTGTPSGEEFPEVLVNIPIQNSPVLGKADAKVTIIEFSDFECPYCQRFNLNTFPSLKSEYIDTGKAKIVFKNFPLPGHADAEPAALASECAFEQNKFWEYHDRIFENQSKLNDSDLKQYAKDLDLDTTKFNSCLDSKKYLDKVKSDINDGSLAGIQGTPSFIINGTLIPGAYPLADFERVINQKLGE